MEFVEKIKEVFSYKPEIFTLYDWNRGISGYLYTLEFLERYYNK